MPSRRKDWGCEDSPATVARWHEEGIVFVVKMICIGTPERITTFERYPSKTLREPAGPTDQPIYSCNPWERRWSLLHHPIHCLSVMIARLYQYAWVEWEIIMSSAATDSTSGFFCVRAESCYLRHPLLVSVIRGISTSWSLQLSVIRLMFLPDCNPLSGHFPQCSFKPIQPTVLLKNLIFILKQHILHGRPLRCRSITRGNKSETKRNLVA